MAPAVLAAVALVGALGTALLVSRRKPKADPALTPEMNQVVTQLTNDLDIAGVGTAQHKVPSAATIAGAQSTATIFAEKGYPLTANAIREMVKMSIGA